MRNSIAKIATVARMSDARRAMTKLRTGRGADGPSGGMAALKIVSVGSLPPKDLRRTICSLQDLLLPSRGYLEPVLQKADASLHTPLKPIVPHVDRRLRECIGQSYGAGRVPRFRLYGDKVSLLDGLHVHLFQEVPQLHVQPEPIDDLLRDRGSGHDSSGGKDAVVGISEYVDAGECGIVGERSD